ncbi:hypothetical protein B0H19DRAFT_686187 [Mycena capillaripes]|nr:hypothetical protein B0H19DRAFT_686187 [Mycena capillaripes]
MLQNIIIPTSSTVNLAAVLDRSGGELGCPEIVSLSASQQLTHSNWPWIDETCNIVRQRSDPLENCGGGGLRVDGHFMANGWTRCDTGAKLCLNPSMSFWTTGDVRPWLSQGNYILSRLPSSSASKNYAVVHQAIFQLIISEPSKAIPEGYLFLCPATDFQSGPGSFRWPECPAYWSLDPSGSTRLRTEAALALGFPAFEMMSAAQVLSWDENTYAGVRQFQEAKGFDPYSQDVARHLGHPLYELPMGIDEPFVHVETDGDEQLEWDTCDLELTN